MSQSQKFPRPNFDYLKVVCTVVQQQRATTDSFQLALCESSQEVPDLSNNDVQAIGLAQLHFDSFQFKVRVQLPLSLLLMGFLED